MHGFVRNDLYSIQWSSEQSTLEFGVGDVLKDEYDFGYHERVTLKLKRNPQWEGDDSCLELVYDEAANVFPVHHPVRIQPDALIEQRQDDFTPTLDTENTTHEAPIDLGANNTLSIVMSTGELVQPSSRGEYEISEAIDLLNRSGRTIDAIHLDGWRIDIGYPEDRDEPEARLQQTDPEPPQRKIDT